MPGDVGDFSVNIGLGINFLAFVSQFVTLRDTLTYVPCFSFLLRGCVIFQTVPEQQLQLSRKPGFG